MLRKILVTCAAAGLVFSLAGGQAQAPVVAAPAASGPSAVDQLAREMAQRIGDELHVKTVIGEPLKAGSVTIIPIMMINVGFGGGGAVMGGAGFYMSGEARPLGFVAVTKKGTRFIAVGKIPHGK